MRKKYRPTLEELKKIGFTREYKYREWGSEILELHLVFDMPKNRCKIDYNTNRKYFVINRDPSPARKFYGDGFTRSVDNHPQDIFDLIRLIHKVKKLKKGQYPDDDL